MSIYYEILGLDAPPADLKAAKRAYATQLKITRPDDDPAGFMALREAYNIARNEIHYAQQNEAPPEAHVVEDMPGADISEPGVHDNHDPVPEPATPPLYDDILALLDNKIWRNSKDKWSVLLDKGHDLTVDEYIYFNHGLRHALLTHAGYYEGRQAIPPQGPQDAEQLISNMAATRIFRAMNWSRIEDRDPYVAHELDWLRKRLDVLNINRPWAKSDSGLREQNVYEAEDSGDGWQIARIAFVIFIIFGGLGRLIDALSTN